jgi:hypothetical protein
MISNADISMVRYPQRKVWSVMYWYINDDGILEIRYEDSNGKLLINKVESTFTPITTVEYD